MNKRDRELLDKQFGRLVSPSRHSGVVIFMIIGMFIAGVTLGGTLSAHETKLLPIVKTR